MIEEARKRVDEWHNRQRFEARMQGDMQPIAYKELIDLVAHALMEFPTNDRRSATADGERTGRNIQKNSRPGLET